MKVLVSACIMGTNCKYNGKNNKNLAVINFLKDKEVISICPEVLAGMKIPRPCAEIVNGIVVDENGNDVFISDAETRYLSSEVAGGFTGTIIGLFAVNEKGDGVSRFEKLSVKHEA